MLPVLIVVPTSLVVNWQNELKKFAPSLSVGTHTNSNEKYNPQYDVMIVTYNMLRISLLDICSYRYSIFVLDEAQNIKNRKTAVNAAASCVTADRFIAVTGTPVENNITDLYSILDMTNRGLFGTARSFANEYSLDRQDPANKEKMDNFRRLIAPFILRREKKTTLEKGVLTDKIIKNEICKLTPVQIGLYEKVMSEDMDQIEQFGDSNLTHREKFKRGSMILAMMQKLKAICNSPAQFDKENPQKYKVADSGKLTHCIDLVRNALKNDGSVLIFTQYVVMGNIIKDVLSKEFKRNIDFLNGSLSAEKRSEVVNRFQGPDSPRILIISLRAGGTGLNLTAANYVIHYDLWWNPAVEDQATDRAHRLGQEKDVIVHRCICKGTFEERIDEIIQSKRAIASAVVQAGEAWIGNLSNKELRKLFALSNN